jgi:hypothetical protein
MRPEAKQSQKQNQRRNPTLEEGIALTQRMFKLLGSKTRHYDQIESWADSAYDAWEGSDLTWEQFTKVVVWALTENEYTVANLRISRDPGKSLFVNQWENVQVFYDAAMAVKVAILRKKNKPICPTCEMAEVTHPMSGLCDECHDPWLKEYDRIGGILDQIAERKLYGRRPLQPEDNMPSFLKEKWVIHYPDAERNPAIVGFFASFETQNTTKRRDHIIRQMLDDPKMLERLDYVWGMVCGLESVPADAQVVDAPMPEPGFDKEEAE